MQDILDRLFKEPTIPWLIASHASPDGDAAGSLIAMGRMLELLEINYCIYTPDPMPAGFENLIDNLNQTTTPQGFENIIALDSAKSFVLLLDEALDKAQCIINIDHHPTNPGYGNFNLLDTSAASTTQMVWEFARQMKLDNVLADPLFQLACYAGITTDTGRFRHSNTTARTLNVASDILNHGLSIEQLQGIFSAPIPYHVQLVIGNAISSAKLLMNGQMLTFYMDVSNLTRAEIDLVKGITFEQLSATKDVNLLLSLRFDKTNDIKASLRCNTQAQWDVNKLAQIFGGGGHRAASGITFTYDNLTHQQAFEVYSSKVAKEASKLFIT